MSKKDLLPDPVPQSDTWYSTLCISIYIPFLPVWHLTEDVEELGAVPRPLAAHSLHYNNEYLIDSNKIKIIISPSWRRTGVWAASRWCCGWPTPRAALPRGQPQSGEDCPEYISYLLKGYLRGAWQSVEEVFYQRYLCAGLKVPGGFPQYCNEHRPNLRLKMKFKCRIEVYN